MSNSCFKIISCGGRDSIDNDDLESSPQSKGASDKRGWSFRKRSARHRVLSNNVISETPPSGIKDSPESAALGIQTQPNSTIPDKISAVQWTEEKPQLPTIVNSKLSEIIAAEANDTKADATPDESVVIIIQASIRGFLARKVLLKHKKVIKLQAAVRGHLVRRQAVGSLRCVQAIIKMQALVRARLARVLEEQSYSVEKHDADHGKDNVSTPMEKENSGSKPLVTYTSIEKLLSNKFASQLLESTPRTKTINIKCDPLKSDSAWKWLQRWMSDSLTEKELSLDTVQPEEKKIEHVVLSLDTVQQQEEKLDHGGELSLDTVQQEKKKIDHGCELSLSTEQPEEKKVDRGGELSLDTVQPGEKIERVEVSLDTVQPEEKKIDHGGELSLDTVQLGEKMEHVELSLDTVLPGEKKIEDVDRQEETVELLSEQYCKPTIEASENYEQPEPHNTNEISSKELTSNSIPTQRTESDFPCKPEPDTIPAGNDTNLVQTEKRTAPEQSETEKKFSSGSRQVSNSVFLDAQSKFDELSTADSTKSNSSINQDTETEKKFSSGSRQVSNPAFLDAQSKFEELSTADLTKSIKSSNQDTEVESYTEIVSSFTDHASSTKKSDLAENFAFDSSKVQYGGSDTPRVQLSECETELSISSTLDSPDRSEAGANEFEPESQFTKDTYGYPESKGNLEVEAKSESTNLDSGLLHVDAVLPERSTGTTNGNDDADDSVISLDLSQVEKKSNVDVGELTNLNSDLPHSNVVHMEAYSNTNGANDDGVDSAIPIDLPQVEKKPNADVCELQIEAKSEKSRQIFKSSPEASPGSHVTGPEPQGTPSSEASEKLKRTRSDKSGSNNKRKSLSAGKTSPSNPNHDSKARKSIEKLPKDHKSAKRRNSFGSPKPDHVDQEPRDSSCSNPLPSYMQPTKSAKAKALPNSSPTSSPDVQDKEFYVKKRHSLPGANGRDGSPQIQRAIPEAQQTAKANGTQSPQEKKWRR